MYAVIFGEQVTEGPLNPSRYAQIDGPGIGGARLAAADFSDSPVMLEGEGGDIIEEEFQASQIMGGNAVVAVPEPDVAETDNNASERRKIITHTIEEDETAESIAKRYGISLNTVLWANNLRARDTLKVGDILTILPTTGVLHIVKSGDTVEDIADDYGVRGIDIAKYNGLEDSDELSLGQNLIVPDGALNIPVAAPRIAPRDEVATADRSALPGVDPKGAAWVWPTTTHHISQGFRWGHTGADIDNKYEPAYASRAGKATFVGWLGGYGNLIVLDHGDGFTSYYAHLSKFYVNKGDEIAQGENIGVTGSTGRSTGPHLHFEIRRNGVPRNPLSYF